MANYNVDIELSVKGSQRLNQVKSSLNQINRLANNLKPLNLLAPGGGNLGNQVRAAMKPLRDFAREAQNSNKTYSNTLAGAISQAETFETVLRNVKVAAGGYGKQVSEVKGFSDAFGQASAKAETLRRNLEQLKRESLQKVGLPIGPSTELGTLDAEVQKINFYTKQKREEARAREENAKRIQREARELQRKNLSSEKEAKLNRRRRLQDIGTGVGFPLLMGGGPAQALAGGIGGAVGGLGGSIIASAAVAQFQLFAEELGKVGQALGSASGAFEFMSDKALFSSDQVRLHAEALIEQGESAKAARLMTGELASAIGQSGIKALKDFGEEAKTLGKLVNTLILRFQAFMANALMPLLDFLNKTLKATLDAQKFEQIRSDLTGPRKEEFDRREKELGIKRTSRGTRGMTSEKKVQLIKEFGLETIEVPGGQITPNLEDLARDREILSKGNKEDKAAKERARKLEESEKLANSLAKQIEFLQVGSEIDRKRLEITYEYVENLDKIFELGETIYTNELRQSALDVQRLQNLQVEVENSLKLAGIRKNINEIAEEGTRIFNSEDDGIGFAAGMEIQLLSKQEEAIQAVIDKYPLIGEAASAAAGLVTSGVNEMINGTKSAEQVFSDFLKSVGDMLIKTAQQMIAQYIAIGIAKAFAGLLGGGGGGIDSFGGGEALGPLTGSMPFTMSPFAEGGYVTGPTNALIGEGGEPEYVIPESKMRESMGRYSRGSRGSSVIPAEGGGAAGTEGGAATAAPIDVRYSVERINSVDYVTADQFQNGMKRAALEGAQRGQQLTLSRLQQSPATRRRIGM